MDQCGALYGAMVLPNKSPVMSKTDATPWIYLNGLHFDDGSFSRYRSTDEDSPPLKSDGPLTIFITVHKPAAASGLRFTTNNSWHGDEISKKNFWTSQIASLQEYS